MTFEAVLTFPHALPVLLISFFVWATYHYTLKCGFVSDDHAGINEYDGKLQGFEYGMLWRWARYWVVGGNFPSQHKYPDGKVIPQGKLPVRHHFLSVLIFNLTCVTTYFALVPILGQKISLMAVGILIVHPCSTQGVAWISGLAYPLSLFWISATVLLLQYFYAHSTLNNAIWVLPVFCLIQWLAIHAIFATTGMLWALLLFLGYWQFAILGFAISLVMCFDQVRKTVSFRVEEFKKQHMEASTVLNFGKPVVAMKTFWYYLCHAAAPVSMGLYHVWGFHYEKDLERRDGLFWKGFLFLCGVAFIFFNTDLAYLKLGILWFLIFSTGFWNWVTAQQFVTERYIFVANLGLGMVIAGLTQNHPWVYTLIFGIYLAKTWDYLPTYDNELRFYQSNNWNFQKSEVAMGNLGVTYTRMGLEDTAKDTWMVATHLNPDYDVPWVNIFYQFRSKGFSLINNGDYISGLSKLKEGLPFLEKALQCKICHFPEQWKKEYSELANAIRNPHLILQDELKRLLQLKENLRTRLSLSHSEKEISDIKISVNNNEAQMKHLIEFFKSNNLPVTDPAPFNKYHTDQTLNNVTQ